jgi:hypothetical protein
MAERSWRLHARQSVFAKLVAIMLAMAASPLVLVVPFFVLYLGPVMDASGDGEHDRRAARTRTAAGWPWHQHDAAGLGVSGWRGRSGATRSVLQAATYDT